MMESAIKIIVIVIACYGIICLGYFLIQEKFIFVPTISGEPFEIKLSATASNVYLNTPNDGKIHALFVKVPNPKGVVFYLHGNTGSLKRWQFMAGEISKFGFHVFVMDYRQYGQSSGKRSEAFMHRDVEHCYDFVCNEYPDLPVVVYGRSLGSGFATRLASRRKCHKLVLETPFFNMIDAAASHLPFLPVRYLLRYKFRSDLHIQHVHCPILILHGTRDIIVKYESAFKLFRLAREAGRDVRMVTLPGGKHSNLNIYPQFNESLAKFLG